MRDDVQSFAALAVAVLTGMLTRSVFGFLRRVTHLVWALAVLGGLILLAVWMLQRWRL
jgi:asparagine N-glycosylation enzyme membrane subunit Stt3